jgi:hypothetical protein
LTIFNFLEKFIIPVISGVSDKYHGVEKQNIFKNEMPTGVWVLFFKMPHKFLCSMNGPPNTLQILTEVFTKFEMFTLVGIFLLFKSFIPSGYQQSTMLKKV